MRAYILGVCGAVIISALLFLLLPGGKLGKFIGGILKLFCVAVMLIFQLAAVTVWLLTKGERPRWFWAVNVWFLSVIPSALIGALLRPMLSRVVAYYVVSSLGKALFTLLYIIVPFMPWAIVSALVTWLSLCRMKK